MGAIRLRSLGACARLGLTCMILVMLAGFVFSAMHLVEHHQMRDERQGLTITDLKGAYSGVIVPSPMVTALRGGHPEELAQEDRGALLEWLAGDRIAEDYDSVDLPIIPADVIYDACINCHARDATEGEGVGKTVPLEFWSDVEAVAFEKRINITPASVMIMSAHTHALTMAVIAIVAALLAVMTRLPGRLVGLLIGLSGLGLLVDLACWWLARLSDQFVVLIAIGGAVFSGATCLLLVLTVLDLWVPRARRPALH